MLAKEEKDSEGLVESTVNNDHYGELRMLTTFDGD